MKAKKLSQVLAGTAILCALAALSSAPMSAYAAKPQKELVCHVNDDGEIKSLMLPSKAASAHERHGDMPPLTYYTDADREHRQTGYPLA